MRTLLALLVLGHGIAHLVGFFVPWKIITSAEVPYRTTVLGGAFDAGSIGIRLVGIGWLILAVGFAAVASGLFLRESWWSTPLIPLLVASLVFCLVGWPDSRFGFLVNLTLLVLLIASRRLGWQV